MITAATMRDPGAMRHRSMLFVPGSNASMMSTAYVYGADAIMFDLEDAVALREKDSARLMVFHALQSPVYAGRPRSPTNLTGSGVPRRLGLRLRLMITAARA